MANNTPKRPCPFFVTGCCWKGVDCAFSHDRPQDGVQNAQNGAQHADTKVQPTHHKAQLVQNGTKLVQNGAQHAQNQTPHAKNGAQHAQNRAPHAQNGAPRATAATWRDLPPRRDDSHPSKRPTAPKEPPTSTESQLRQWRFDIPLNPTDARPLGIRLGTFFQKAQKLASGEPAVTQEIITALASDGGLHRVSELVSRDFTPLGDRALQQTFTTQIVPFFQLLSHKNVERSALLEERMVTLYTFLYGPNGQRAVKLLEAAARYLPSIVKTDASDDDRHAVESVLAVFTKIMDTNPTAFITQPFKVIVETLAVLLEPPNAATEPLSRAALKNLRKIQQRLNIGQNIPNAGRDVVAYNGDVPTYHIDRDKPGELSVDGRRHNNDHASINKIKIMPTLEEILSARNEYLPTFDPDEWHVPALPGLLDRHFRLLREDSVGQLRDGCKAELERLQDPLGNVRFEDFGFDDRNGLEFAVSFDQPFNYRSLSEQGRAKAWEDSRRLEHDSLVCLIDAHGGATFLMVSLPMQNMVKAPKMPKTHHLHKKYSRSQDGLRAYAVVRFVEYHQDIAKQVLSFFHSYAMGSQLSLVEFPGVLVPAFLPTLQALQQMNVSLDLPFADLILQSQPNDVAEVLVPAPSYATSRDFRFDLSAVLHGESTFLDINTDGTLNGFDMEAFKQNTPLDDGQADALISSLSRSFAITQGPPGTGKSYTGIGLMKVLLDNKTKADLGPILLVSYTNHALDQMLEHLLDAGITQIVRVGSRSKSERLRKLNIRVIGEKFVPTKTEKREKWELRRDITAEGQAIEVLLNQVMDIGSQNSIAQYLELANEAQWNQLFGRQLVDNDGFTVVDHHPEQRLLRWLQGIVLPPSTAAGTTYRPVEDIVDNDLQSLSLMERAGLHRHWMSEIHYRIGEGLARSLQIYHDRQARLDLVRTELDLRAVAQADIIGVTTSGLARNLTFLRKLSSKVLVSEEAGEIQESHLLTALLPSLEHVILIGDHLQLRPQVANYFLSSESKEGSQYCLDISLFERLVKPLTGAAQPLPFNTLSTQRRMHPSISELIRSTLYLDLLDAPTVADYPDVVGMRRRLFWLNHDHEEDALDPDSLSTSKTNQWEADMTVALVSHVVRQGIYKPSDIAVLTPYLGQLRVLRDRLRSQYEILLSNQDAIELGEASGEPEDDRSEASGDEDADTSAANATAPKATKGTLMEAIRLSTVDNFQGEEAKVVIIGLVRCNEKLQAGFLRTENRINVLLSRAMHGMYIIGNAATAATVPMWEKIIQILQPDNMGDKIELCCPRHPEKAMLAGAPEDFFNLAPAGGCQELCGRRLECGHRCPQPCHSDLIHSGIYCQKDCSKVLAGCNHPCPNKCGDACPRRCEVRITEYELELECGHFLKHPACWQTQELDRLQCTKLVSKTIPGCNHTALLACCEDEYAPGFVCKAACAANLDCGHTCKKPCHKCNKRGVGMVLSRDHGTCETICSRPYQLCKHSCPSICHEGKTCAPCKKQCDVACSHSRCSRNCNEPCIPCAEEVCASQCEHSACEMPCAAPCDRIPCSRRCSKLLSCGCRCPSVCGEICPDKRFCQNCGNKEILSQQVEFLESNEYKNVDLDEDPVIVLNCGHVFTISTLDSLMEMGKFYKLDEDDLPGAIEVHNTPGYSKQELKCCPNCRGSLRNIGRYGRIVRRAQLDESTKKFISWSNAEYRPTAERLMAEHDKLAGTAAEAKLASRTLHLTGDRQHQILAIHRSQGLQRYGSIFSARRQIMQYMQKVKREEQPYQKVRDMVEAVRRKKAGEGVEIAPFDFDQSLLQTRASLLASALLLRCDLSILSDVLAARHNTPVQGTDTDELKVDFSINRLDCEALIQEAKKSLQVAQEAEGHVYWARFAALEMKVAPSDEEYSDGGEHKTARLREDALEHLDAADVICYVNASQTTAVLPEIEPTRKMLNDAVFYTAVSNDEMKAVVAAMANEFSGTGHWYLCANGHPFTVGECGAPMQVSTCPQCGATVGGEEHEAVEGVTRADDIEERFAGMELDDE